MYPSQKRQKVTLKLRYYNMAIFDDIQSNKNDL